MKFALKHNTINIFTVMKEKLIHIKEWMKNHHIPPRLMFLILGIISTIWFLIRVIPKPVRATYPCMRVAAPFMSGFVVYLLSVGGLTIVSRKFGRKFLNVRYASAFLSDFYSDCGNGYYSFR